MLQMQDGKSSVLVRESCLSMEMCSHRMWEAVPDYFHSCESSAFLGGSWRNHALRCGMHLGWKLTGLLSHQAVVAIISNEMCWSHLVAFCGAFSSSSIPFEDYS